SVYVGGPLPTGPTPVASSYGAVSTTAPDGSFTATGIQGVNTGENYDPAHFGWTATWIVVWPKDPALPVYHATRIFANTAGANALGTITLVRMSANDLAALAAMNSYRAAQGSPPLALDETLVEAARYWGAYTVRYPGTGHSCVAGIDPPDCINAQGYESARGERGAGENLAGASTTAQDGGLLEAGWAGALAAYESEAAQCPQPAQYTTCAAYQQTLFASGQPDFVGHWINLVNPSLTWTGLALVSDTRPGSSPGDLIADNEFGSLL
ncbi:MAG: CAP domain-containing protein, partial [Candidatus Eremiobacteraeota bacterium]|nr:CAP domain-containing protein [Candidatus Eremiobacteraeota bacterium]